MRSVLPDSEIKAPADAPAVGRNLYVHVPFCKTKCRYCAFYSETGTGEALLRDYPALIAREVALRSLADARPQTVYVGGGTPSLLGPEGLEALFARLPRPADGAEMTVELNPGDVSPALAAALGRCGVTRASLGAQSFDAATLQRLGRRHGPEAIGAAVATLRAAGVPQLSLDLIIGIPGCDAAVSAASLRRALELAPEHISVYPLSIEAGTAFARDGLHPVPDDAMLSEVAQAEALLTAAGYERYELSNYARPGAGCRHNLAVWLGEDYTGIGPAACSREGLTRRANARNVAAWRTALLSGAYPPAEVTLLSPDEDESERFTTRVRLQRWCVPPEANGAVWTRRRRALQTLERTGIVRCLFPGQGLWTLTPRGREVADAVMAELL